MAPGQAASGWTTGQIIAPTAGSSLFVDRVRIQITSSDPSRPLFAGIAATGDAERYPGGVSYTTVDGHGVTGHPGTGSRRLRPPRCPGPR